MKTVTLPIKKLFQAIEQKENHKFEPYQEYNQSSKIKIKDENGVMRNVPFLITKTGTRQIVTFDNGETVDASTEHLLSYNLKDCKLLCDYKVGDVVQKATGETFKITKIEIMDTDDVFYDLNISTDTHLYQDSKCFVHHNTAIIEKMALDIVADRVPKQIQGWEIYSIDVTSIIAGAKFRGDFEKRLQDILKELEKKENCIAFIDEFHTMFGLGANSSNQLDATNILKPAMMNGKIRITGATTYEEAKNTVDKNKPMARRFQKVDVVEPDEETTFEILKGLKATFEDYHNVSYTDKILKQIVSLSGKYLVDTHFPDKAIDVVDEVGSVIKLTNQTEERVAIKEKDITDLISKKARVPVTIEEGDDKLGLANLAENIQAKLYGQDHAIFEVADKIMMGRAGLNEPGKPLGSFLLAGPSGVGKCLSSDTKVRVKVSQELYNKILENRKQ